MSSVSCAVCGWLLDLIAHAEQSAEDWVRDLPVELDRLRNPHQRVDWDVFATLCERLETLFGGELELERAARDFFDQHLAPAEPGLAAIFDDERQLLWIAQHWLTRSWIPYLSLEASQPRSAEVLLVAELPAEVRPCPQLFTLGRAVLPALPRLLGRPAAQVTAHTEARRARYRLALPPAPAAREAAPPPGETAAAASPPEEQARRLAAAVESSAELVALLAADGRLLYLNHAGQQWLGLRDATEVRARTLFDFLSPEDAHRMRFRDLPEVLRGAAWQGDAQLRNARTGAQLNTLASLSPISGADAGEPALLGFVARDIGERRAAEQALMASEQRFRTLVENANDLIAEIDAFGRFAYVSPSYGERLGYTPPDLLGKPLLEIVHPEDRARAEAALTGLADRPSLEAPEFRVRHRDGRWCWLQTHLKHHHPSEGEPLVVATSRDVTARRETEQALRESEERLVQSQKMEAIGRLAGGVAHDFNNLLTAITGYGDLVLQALGADHPMRDDAEEILRSARRASALTRQLLAFSRRQVLQPTVLDLNALVADIDRLLRRLIGEDVELVTSLEGSLARVKVDPAQMEQLLLNLAVNARDAMPGGGRLAISTDNLEIAAGGDPAHPGVPHGSYAVLQVRDDGVGMDEATRARIFEPFFTTKGPDKGTGLGLSTVYGIVRQSGGHIRVESEPGDHTVFTVYLPEVREPEAAAAQPLAHTDLRGSERVLVVEDEEPVRRLLRRCLSGCGYRVLDAGSGIEALRLLRRHNGKLDLLITDVVLPKMSGRELADRVRRARPEARVLYISGFADDALAEHGGPDPDALLVAKPFAPAGLLRTVREVLDEAPRPPPATPPRPRNRVRRRPPTPPIAGPGI